MADRMNVYVIQKDARDEKKSHWLRCGVAFVNRDNSINVKLDLFPNVQIQIREPDENEQG